MTTDRALTVIETNGELAVEWEYGALPQLQGYVREIAIVGAGPSRLPPPEPVARRTITGRVVDESGGSPAAAPVELCSAPGWGSLCPSSSRFGQGVVNEGMLYELQRHAFTIKDVPSRTAAGIASGPPAEP